MHYLDNAASSFPKPPDMAAEVLACLDQPGNPGRGSSLVARTAGEALEAARRDVAAFLGCAAPGRLAFTLNATDALNLALRSVARSGRVVTSAHEHAAVMRPLRRLQRERGLALDIVAPEPDGTLSPRAVGDAARGAEAVVLSAASNVTGVLQPVAEIAACLPPGVPLIVDAAQAAGSAPLVVDDWGPHAVTCLSGHKGLLGPMGCGVVVVGSAIDLQAAREGGTGESGPDDPTLPGRLEAGTLPLPAIRGLAAGVRWWMRQGAAAVRGREAAQAARLEAAVARCAGESFPAVRLATTARVPLLAFRLPGWSPEELAAVLESEGIVVRAGLHCAPDTHRALGTWPDGLVRVSVGPTTHDDDVAAFEQALASIAAG